MGMGSEGFAGQYQILNEIKKLPNTSMYLAVFINAVSVHVALQHLLTVH
jgi:hypothetical protein